MISRKELSEEIGQALETAIARKEVIKAPWLIQRIIKSWELPGGEDSDRWARCGYEFVQTLVRKAVSAVDTTAKRELDPQGVLEGFDRVQKVYLIERDKEQCIVPTHQLTDEELSAKVEELLSMSAGCEKHAEELERYREMRLSKTRRVRRPAN